MEASSKKSSLVDTTNQANEQTNLDADSNESSLTTQAANPDNTTTTSSSYKSDDSYSYHSSSDLSDDDDDSMDAMQEIMDSLQNQIRQYKQLLESTKSSMQKEIQRLQSENGDLMARIRDKDKKLSTASEAIETMVGELKNLREENSKLYSESISDKNDLEALYDRLGKLENNNTQYSLNELEVSLVLKLQKDQVVSANVVTKSIDEQKSELKQRIGVQEKQLLKSKSEALSLKRKVDEAEVVVKQKNALQKEMAQIKKEKMDLQNDVNQLTTQLEAAKKRRSQISIKGESDEQSVLSVDAKEIINKINESNVRLFDAETYEEFALLQQQQQFHAYMFTHTQAQCHTKLRKVLESFLMSSDIPAVKQVRNFTDVYNNVSVRCFFATFIKREAPHLKIYHDILVDISQFSSKYHKNTTKAVSPSPSRRQLPPTPTRDKSTLSSITSSSTASPSMLRRRRPTAVSVIPSLETYGLLANSLVQSTPSQSPQQQLQQTLSPEIQSDILPDTFNFVISTSNEVWGFGPPFDNNTLVSVFSDISNGAAHRFSVDGSVKTVLYHNNVVYVALNDGKVLLFNTKEHTRIATIAVSQRAVVHLELVNKNVIAITEDKKYVEFDDRRGKIRKAIKLTLQSDITTAAVVGDHVWVGTLAGVAVCSGKGKVKEKTTFIKEVKKEEVIQVLKVFHCVWIVQSIGISIVDVESKSIKKILPSDDVVCLKLLGRQVWILGKYGKIRVYDAEKLEVDRNINVGKWKVNDVCPVFKVSIVPNSVKEIKEWLAVVVGENDRLVIVKTNFHYHQYFSIPTNKNVTRTCRLCGKRFNKDGIYCKHCNTIFLCEKCAENISYTRMVTANELCFKPPNKRVSIKKLSK
ncbi:FYVE-type domain-containing protein [Entamoeba marina]